MSTLEKIINAASDLSEAELKEVLRAVKNVRIADKPSYERLHLIARKMHGWIFLNSGDEQAVYDELGLTDEENAFLGYVGQFTCVVEMPKEGENHAEARS